MKRKLVILMMFIGCIGLSAQAKKIVFQQYKLDNGLNVILHQDNTNPIVNVSVLYHVGSKNEDPKRT